MSLSDAILAEVPFLRGEAESLMLDSGVALRPLENEWVVVDGVEVQDVAMLFDSSCKVKPPRTVVSENEVGGRTAVTVPGELHLPATPANSALTDGDLFEIATVHPLSLSQVGRRYRIKGEVDGTLVTACRYAVERVVS